MGERMKRSLSWAIRGLVLTLHALLALGNCVAADASSALLADVSIQFTCQGMEHDSLESDIEKFVLQNGFKVLNQGRVQRLNGVNLQSLRILGIHENDTFIEFMALPYQKERYAVRLNTRPPTKRDSKLEGALEKFLTQMPKCQTRQVSRGENPYAARDFFDQEMKRIRGLFRQAEELKGHRRLSVQARG